MTERALLLAVIEALQVSTDDPDAPGLGLDRNYIWLAPVRGQPPANAAETYVGVWVGSTMADRRPMGGLAERVAVNVTISQKMNKVPFDRFGDWLATDEAATLEMGLEKLIGQVRLAIHQDSCDHRIIKRANNILHAANFPSTGYIEPLYYKGCGEREWVGGDWFHSRDKTARRSYHGVVATLRFADALRLQRFNDPAGMS